MRLLLKELVYLPINVSYFYFLVVRTGLEPVRIGLICSLFSSYLFLASNQFRHLTRTRTVENTTFRRNKTLTPELLLLVSDSLYIDYVFSSEIKNLTICKIEALGKKSYLISCKGIFIFIKRDIGRTTFSLRF